MIAVKNPSLEWKWTKRKAFVNDIMEKAPASESDFE